MSHLDEEKNGKQSSLPMEKLEHSLTDPKADVFTTRQPCTHKQAMASVYKSCACTFPLLLRCMVNEVLYYAHVHHQSD